MTGKIVTADEFSITRPCAQCGKSFVTDRVNIRVCSEECRAKRKYALRGTTPKLIQRSREDRNAYMRAWTKSPAGIKSRKRYADKYKNDPAYREHVNKSKREYYAKNREKVKAWGRAHYTKHRDAILAKRRPYFRAWYAKNRDAILERRRNARRL